jgi:hypothetical protein
MQVMLATVVTQPGCGVCCTLRQILLCHVHESRKFSDAAIIHMYAAEYHTYQLPQGRPTQKSVHPSKLEAFTSCNMTEEMYNK